MSLGRVPLGEWKQVKVVLWAEVDLLHTRRIGTENKYAEKTGCHAVESKKHDLTFPPPYMKEGKTFTSITC